MSGGGDPSNALMCPTKGPGFLDPQRGVTQIVTQILVHVTLLPGSIFAFSHKQVSGSELTLGTRAQTWLRHYMLAEGLWSSESDEEKM